jgi:hypothetical protein
VGGLRWYVATLVDVTPDAKGVPVNFRLPSSPPTECTRSVFFSGVVAEGRTQGLAHDAHQYSAEIDGYSEPSLRPKHEGGRVMTNGGQAVEPGWLGSCGAGGNSLAPLLGVDAGASTDPLSDGATAAGPVRPFPGKTVTVRGCRLLPLSDTDATTRVMVDPTVALGALECGDEPGQVTGFEVTVDDEVRTADCGSAAVFRNVAAGEFLEFQVVAFTSAPPSDGGAGEPSAAWTTTCYQEAVAGQQLQARCDPFAELQ